MSELSRVRHALHGPGTLLVERDGIATVELDTGVILKLPRGELTTILSVAGAMAAESWGSPLSTALRGLALAIRSTQEQWGVFGRSRVALLPHQLWVCHRVLSRWPARWLIADDVGLGKTIEAGLILTPLLARGRVRRLLVLAPAGLVDQWVERLRDMFDIRAARYHPEVDQPRDDFWRLHPQVVASIHTLRLDHADRWERLREAEPWDLVLVDEAHHLSEDESGGRTLGLRLLDDLDSRGLIRGLLLFTGTPHRGKDHGFLALLRLLDRSIDPRRSITEYLHQLPGLMIRNNKQAVTNMKGDRLFQPLTVHDIQYDWTPPEARFYARLTEFILTGRAYAGGLRLGTQRSVMLVLTTMQKLAASSVAAVRRAIERRLARLRAQEKKEARRRSEMDLLWRELTATESPDTMDSDRRAMLEERIDELMEAVQLNPDEIPALEELVRLADDVMEESRVRRLLELVQSLPGNCSVLIFTEYKATQGLVLSALSRQFGSRQVTFINGDGALTLPSGEGEPPEILRSERADVARRFNAGTVRFLVSTEAAGEGVDLQGCCHTLVHFDLPWNPMRMHQRVGRLNRYGQKLPVDVFLLRNPVTVEGRIWSCLEEKLNRIGVAFAGAMADPDDIRLLVLGLTTPAFHEQLATRALGVDGGRFDSWYNAETTSFGGTDVLAMVRALIGSPARFDFATDAPGLPRVDLPDLLPFIRAALRLRGRRLDEREDGTLSFITPEHWLESHHTIRDRYEVHLDRRRVPSVKGPTLLGAGHRLMEAALDDAIGATGLAASVPDLTSPLVIFTCYDELSDPSGPARQIVVGAERQADATWLPLQDWELVHRLNRVIERPDRQAARAETSRAAPDGAEGINLARVAIMAWLPTLDLRLRRLGLREEVILWPA
jgi:superfamily II DNA or RNA helicase